MLRFPKILKDYYIWLQIIQMNQMPGVSGFPHNPLLLEMWIPFETCKYPDTQAQKNYICYKLTILPFFTYYLTNGDKKYL